MQTEEVCVNTTLRRKNIYVWHHVFYIGALPQVDKKR